MGVRKASFADIIEEDCAAGFVVSVVHPVSILESSSVGRVEMVKGKGDSCCDRSRGSSLPAEDGSGGAECGPDLREDIDEEW